MSERKTDTLDERLNQLHDADHQLLQAGTLIDMLCRVEFETSPPKGEPIIDCATIQHYAEIIAEKVTAAHVNVQEVKRELERAES